MLLPAIVPKVADEGRNDNTNTVVLAQHLSIPKAETDVAVMAKPLYKNGVTCGKSVMAMHIANALLDTWAGVNLVHSRLITPE